MITCPNCQAENRSGAKFCKSCATRLPDSPAATRPLVMEEELKHDPVDPRTYPSGKFNHPAFGAGPTQRD